MKVTIPYTFEEETIPYRCRKPRLVEFDAEMTLTVKEPAEEEFPVVGILHGHRQSECDRVETAIELRKLGGRFFSRQKWPYLDCREETVEIGGLAKEITASSGCGYYGARFSCGKQEARRRLMAASREYVVFRDEVWASCGEPMYLVQTFGLGHNHGGTAMFVEGSYNSNISKDRYVPATDLSGAVKLFFETAYGRGDTDDAETMKGRIERGEFFARNDYVEVVDAAAFTANPQRDGYDGDPFLNGVETMIRGTESPVEAGLMLLLTMGAETL